MKIVFYDVADQERELLSKSFPAGQFSVVLKAEEVSSSTIEADSEVISMFVNSTVSSDVISKLPKLKLIACRSTGFNNVDMAAAKAHGVQVVNVPTYGQHTVAEYTFGLLLTLTRKLEQAITAAHSGTTNRTELQGTDLNGKTMGIIGAGRIGSCVAQIAKGFGMRVIAHDKFKNNELASKIGFEYVPIEDLLNQSDVVSLHTPYTKDNHHLLNASLLKLMRHGAILLNTARGELVDNKALIEGLESGHISGVALDVVEGEQLLSTEEELLLLRSENVAPEKLQHSLEISLLQKLPNVIVTNHNAFNTVEAIGRINQTTVDNVTAFATGKPVNVVA